MSERKASPPPPPAPRRDFITTWWFDVVWLGCILLMIWGINSCIKAVNPKPSIKKAQYHYVSHSQKK